MKKIIAIVVVAIMMLQASAIFAAEITAYNFQPTIDGVIAEGEYPADSAFVLNKEFVDSIQGNANGTIKDYMQATYYYAWDEENLYIAVEAVDKTPVKPTTWDIRNDAGVEGSIKADGIQFVTFCDKQYHRWFSIGLKADGTLAARTHYFPYGNDRLDLANEISGKGTYTETGLVIEVAIPWIFVIEGPQNCELSDEETAYADEHYFLAPLDEGVEFAEGQTMTMMMAYIDMDGDEQTRYNNNDGQKSIPMDSGDYVILAGAKPAADAGSDDQGTTDTGSDDQGTTDTGSDDQGTTDTGSDDQGTTDTGSDDQGTTDTGADQGTTDDGADTGVDTGDDAAQTFDFGVIALVAAVVSAAAMLLKKKR